MTERGTRRERDRTETKIKKKEEKGRKKEGRRRDGKGKMKEIVEGIRGKQQEEDRRGSGVSRNK